MQVRATGEDPQGWLAKGIRVHLKETPVENQPTGLEESFFRLVQELNRNQVDYILVGGMAVNLHGLVRATEDIDLFIRPDVKNIARLRKALRAVWNDPCIDEITNEDLMGDYPVVRYGPPEGTFVIDLIARLGEAFCYEDLEAQSITANEVPIRVATPGTLFRMKRDTVRPRARADALVLQEKFALEDE